MRYEMMYPHQISQAIEENWPVVLPLGVLEYHGEHSVAGVDTLLVIRALEIIEKETNMIILPPFYYGAASYAVEKPEGSGTIHVRSEVLNLFGKELYASLLRIGFKNIHAFIHHQSENFSVGMPTDLAFKLAARQAIFEHLEKQNGENWWGDNSMENYYSDHEKGSDPFSWIQHHALLDSETQKEFPIDHTGKQEISLMMAFCPEGVDMSRFTGKKWYTRTAAEANTDYGNNARTRILESLRKILITK